MNECAGIGVGEGSLCGNAGWQYLGVRSFDMFPSTNDLLRDDIT